MAVIINKPNKSLAEYLGEQLRGSMAHERDVQTQTDKEKRAFERELSLNQQKQAQKAQQGALMSQLLGGGIPQQTPMFPSRQGQEMVPGQAGEQMAPGQQQAPQRKGFAESSWEEIAPQLAQAGLSSNEVMQVKKMHDAQKQHAETLDLQKQTLRVRQEAPDRKALTEDVREISKEAKNSARSIQNYETLSKLAGSGQLRSGAFRQALDLVGLGDILQNPVSQVFEKIAVENNLHTVAGLGGRTGAELLKQAAKGNINARLQPQAIQSIAKIYSATEKKNVLLDKKITEIKKKAQDKGEQVPLDLIDKARDSLQPEFEKINSQINQEVESLVDTGVSQSSNPIGIPKGVKAGTTLINPITKNREVFIGGGKTVPAEKWPEIQQGIAEIESSIPAAQSVGRRIVNKKLGITLESDGKQWKPVA